MSIHLVYLLIIPFIIFGSRTILHFIRFLCLSTTTDYLVSRAEATLGSIDKVKKGHSDYLTNMGGELLITWCSVFLI